MKYILALLVLTAIGLPVSAAELSRASFKQVASLTPDDFRPFGPVVPPKPTPPAPEPEPEPEPVPPPMPPVVPNTITVGPTFYYVPYAQPVIRYQSQPVFRGAVFPARGGFYNGGGVTCVGGG